MAVSATVRYLGREGKLFVFEVIARGRGGEIGRATHRQAIVLSERLVAGAVRRNGGLKTARPQCLAGEIRTDTLAPVRPSCHRSGRRGEAVVAPVLVLLAAFGAGCADYKADMNATTTIYEVRVTTHAADVAGCRLIERVDSRDPDKGCGLTVQPTPQECLRYQVRRAGGDTLLMRGPAGDAYDCSGRTTSAAEAAPSTAPTAPPAAAPASAPPPAPAPTAAPAAASAPPAAPVPALPPQAPAPAEPRPASKVRMTRDRESAKGCVYLGDVPSQIPCVDEGGEASGDCADRALEAGGDLIVADGARTQIFSCKARP